MLWFQYLDTGDDARGDDARLVTCMIFLNTVNREMTLGVQCVIWVADTAVREQVFWVSDAGCVLRGRAMKLRLFFTLPKPLSGAETSGGPRHSVVTPKQVASRFDIRVIHSPSDRIRRSVSSLYRLRPDVSGPPSLSPCVSEAV